MSDKASKSVVHYRAGTKDRRCSLCSMFRPPAECTAVKGDISPYKLCDYFKRKK